MKVICDDREADLISSHAKEKIGRDRATSQWARDTMLSAVDFEQQTGMRANTFLEMVVKSPTAAIELIAQRNNA